VVANRTAATPPALEGRQLGEEPQVAGRRLRPLLRRALRHATTTAAEGRNWEACAVAVHPRRQSAARVATLLRRRREELASVCDGSDWPVSAIALRPAGRLWPRRIHSASNRATQLGQVVVPFHDDLDRSTVEHRRRDSLKGHPQFLDPGSPPAADKAAALERPSAAIAMERRMSAGFAAASHGGCCTKGGSVRGG
jgi:hypothetical protein